MSILIKPLPPIDLLRDRFSYDEVTGKVTRRVDRGTSYKAGTEAGGIHHSGRRVINVDGRICQTSRIAYALYYGVDPYPYEVDHYDRDVLNNRITNLILTDRIGNNNNKDHSKSAERIRQYGIAQRKQVEVIYPDGKVVTTESIKAAADLLGVDTATINNRAANKYIGGKLTGFQITIKHQ
jgi:hypothetical protein